MKLRYKLFLPILLMWCGMFATFQYYWLPSYMDRDMSRFENEQTLKMQFLLSGLTNSILSGDYAHIYGSLNKILAENDNWIEICLYNTSGKLIYPLDKNRFPKNSTQITLNYTHRQAQEPIVTSELTVDTRHLIEEQNILAKEFSTLFFVIFFIAITLSMILEYKLIQKPLALLVKAAKKISYQDYSYDLKTNRSDEIGELLNAFASMSQDTRKYQIAVTHARDKAEEASEAKSEFLAKMSHEFRTPLNAILGYCDIVQEDIETLANEATIKDLSKIRGSGKHLLSLINDLLDLSKIESGKMDSFISSFSLNTLTSELVDIVQPLARNNDNNLSVETSNSIDIVNSDEKMVKQILYNLISNAIKFTHKGNITVKIEEMLYQNESFFRVDVIDTGIGIENEKLQSLFDPFVQVENSYNRKFDGTGLGLALSKQICKVLGGDIEVISKPGEGSVFSFWLPTASRLETAA